MSPSTRSLNIVPEGKSTPELQVGRDGNPANPLAIQEVSPYALD
jgi:hypothetical protein